MCRFAFLIIESVLLWTIMEIIIRWNTSEDKFAVLTLRILHVVLTIIACNYRPRKYCLQSDIVSLM